MDSWGSIFNNLLNHGYSKAQAQMLIGRCYRLAMHDAIHNLVDQYDKGEEDILNATTDNEESCD